MKGKLIVLYGINNLGKTTQAKLLVDKLNEEGKKSEYLKYPAYDIFPSGEMLNNFLRGGNKYGLGAREAQIIYAFNRAQFEPILKEKLNEGINIIAEDYIGTGIAWGIGSGVEEGFLNEINSGLLKEDFIFLFDGKRFAEAIEKDHKFENDKALIDKVRGIHLELGEKYGWKKINANLTIEEIHNILWEEINDFL